MKSSDYSFLAFKETLPTLLADRPPDLALQPETATTISDGVWRLVHAATQLHDL